MGERRWHVIVFDLYKVRPVGHYTGPFEKDQEGGFHHSRMTTLCGQVVHDHVWVEHHDGDTYHSVSITEEHRGTYLRHDHLDKIGHLCKRCEARAERDSEAAREAEREPSKSVVFGRQLQGGESSC